MIKFLMEKITGRKNFLLLKKYTAPSKEFLNESRGFFINELKKRGVIAPARANIRLSPLRKALSYGFASLFALSSVTGGAIVYAQKENVDFNHPLYPMKRLGENIQVGLASAEEKPVLQDELAQKRLTEIKQLIAEKEEEIILINSQKIAEAKQISEQKDREAKQIAAEDSEAFQKIEEQKKQDLEQIEERHKKEIEKIEKENKVKTERLDDDFREAVESVLKDIKPSEDKPEDREKAKDLCESLREKIKERKEVLREEKRWPDFENKCGEAEEKD